jgi:signal transduction histidine kinase
MIELVRAADLDTLLARAARAARELTGARYGAIGVWRREDPTALARFVTSGLDEEEARRIGELPVGSGLLGLARERLVSIPDIAEDPDRVGFPPGHPAMHSFLGAPISVRGDRYGTLYVTDRRDGLPFDEVDTSVLLTLTGVLAAVLESLALRDELAETLVASDRLRIARDLHDDVIQRLFGVGLTVQAALRETADPRAAALLSGALDDLDATIQGLRTTIFDLEQARRTSLRGEILELVERLTAASGVQHQVTFEGPVDLGIPERLRATVVAVVRELVTNALRHAKPRRIHVAVSTSARSITVTVADDGVGFDPSTTTLGHGLANLSARASELGGRFEVRPGAPSGATARFEVPVATTAERKRHEA